MEDVKLNPIAEKILSERYYLPGENWESLCRRVAKAISLAEKEEDRTKWEERFFQIMYTLDFLPNSPTLMNAGTELGQLSACFVLPVEDSMEGIFSAKKWTALIHQSGGGTGFNFSNLRPEGSPVKSTNGVASGPLSFIETFNCDTNVIKQGGKRRGANMGILDASHPDIKKFIMAKDNPNICPECSSEPPFSNFNFSVMVTDEFMDKTFERHTEESDIFEHICQQAWKNGEPGLLFEDSINHDNTVSGIGTIKATNPCGEVPLLPFESCNLGSINLLNMLDVEGNFDYPKFKKTVEIAIRFLDNVIDVNRYPLEPIDTMTKLTRRIGLGVMGYHDMLIKRGIAYDSTEALQEIQQIGEALNDVAIWASNNLAEERGVFPAYPGSYWNKRDVPLRNCALTSIAPTGTLSRIAGVSSSIEPNIEYQYEWGVLDTKLLVKHWALEMCFDPNFDPSILKTSSEISPDWHLMTLTTWQTYIQNGVSKTIILPETATVEQVKRTFKKAWEMGVKGITVYRDGSRKGQPVKKCDDPEKCTL